MPDPIPDPAWVRYAGPGAKFDVRCTIGPYRALVEAERGVPVAVPQETAGALAGRGDFEHVDPVDAAAEIVEHDQARAAEQADWEERQAAARDRRQRDRGLVEIEAGRLEAMRVAALAEREAGGSQSEIVAAAATAEHEYRAALAGLSSGG